MNARNRVFQHVSCLKLWVTKGTVSDIVILGVRDLNVFVHVLTGFTRIHRPFMHVSQMFLHVGDRENLFTNSAGITYFLRDVRRGFTDISNTFSTHFTST